MIIETNRIPPKMSGTTVKALAFLQETPGASVESIAARLELAQATTSAALVRAAEKGLIFVETGLEDKRLQLHFLSEKGAALVSKMAVRGGIA